MNRLNIYITIASIILAITIIVIVYSAQYSVSLNYTVNINVSSQFNPIIAYKKSYSIINVSSQFNPIIAYKKSYSIINVSSQFNPIIAYKKSYIIYTTICLSVNITRSSGQTEIVIRNLCTTTSAILTISLSYTGYICTDTINGYIYVFDNRTGIIITSLYIPSSNRFMITLARGSTYRLVFPRSASCISGNCTGNLNVIYIGNNIYTSETVSVTMTDNVTVSAIYRVSIVPPCKRTFIVSPFTSVSVGECPDRSSLCYWFGTSIATKYSCTAFGEIYIIVYEYQHSEEIKLSINESIIASLAPSIHQSYRQRLIKVECDCPLCIATVSSSCRVIPLTSRQQIQILDLPVPTFTPPSIGMATPSIESSHGLIMIGSIVGLFAFLVRRLRWTQALFITAVVLSTMGMLLLGSPQLFAVGMVIAVASVVMDRYM